MQSLNNLKWRVKSIPTRGDVPCTPAPGSPGTAENLTPFRCFQPETPARQRDSYLRSGTNKTLRTKTRRSSDSPKANPSGRMPRAPLWGDRRGGPGPALASPSPRAGRL